MPYLLLREAIAINKNLIELSFTVDFYSALFEKSAYEHFSIPFLK